MMHDLKANIMITTITHTFRVSHQVGSYLVIHRHEDFYCTSPETSKHKDRVCLLVCSFVCVFARLFACLLVCLVFCLFVRLVVCIYDCLFDCLFD